MQRLGQGLEPDVRGRTGNCAGAGRLGDALEEGPLGIDFLAKRDVVPDLARGLLDRLLSHASKRPREPGQSFACEGTRGAVECPLDRDGFEHAERRRNRPGTQGLLLRAVQRLCLFVGARRLPGDASGACGGKRTGADRPRGTAERQITQQGAERLRQHVADEMTLEPRIVREQLGRRLTDDLAKLVRRQLAGRFALVLARAKLLVQLFREYGDPHEHGCGDLRTPLDEPGSGVAEMIADGGLGAATYWIRIARRSERVGQTARL